MATHSSILAWRIPGTEELDGLQPWGRREPDMTEDCAFMLTRPWPRCSFFNTVISHLPPVSLFQKV